MRFFVAAIVIVIGSCSCCCIPLRILIAAAAAMYCVCLQAGCLPPGCAHSAPLSCRHSAATHGAAAMPPPRRRPPLTAAHSVCCSVPGDGACECGGGRRLRPPVRPPHGLRCSAAVHAVPCRAGRGGNHACRLLHRWSAAVCGDRWAAGLGGLAGSGLRLDAHQALPSGYAVDVLVW